MAEIALTTVPGPYKNEGDTPQLADLTYTATETGGNTVSVHKLTLVAFKNTDVGAQTVTIPSTNDPYGRVAPITAFSIPAGGTVYRFFASVGWESATGSGIMEFTTSDVAIEAAAVRFN